MGIVFQCKYFIYDAYFGINQGSQPIIGFNYGAKSTIELRKLYI